MDRREAETNGVRSTVGTHHLARAVVGITMEQGLRSGTEILPYGFRIRTP
jgi:hypothetical protein